MGWAGCSNGELRLVAARDSDLLGDGEVVGSRILPVDKVDGLGVLLDPGLAPLFVAEQTAGLPVGLV